MAATCRRTPRPSFASQFGIPGGLVAEPAPEVVRQRLRRGIAARGRLLEALQADGLQPGRDPGTMTRRGDRLGGADQGHRQELRRAHEGGAAGQHLVEDGPEGVHVRRPAGVRGAALRLLRGHVARGAEDRLRIGQGRRCPLAGLRIQPLGQAEVGDPGRAVPGQEDVGRLQVPMQDALAMRVLDRRRQRAHQFGGLPRLEGPVGQSPFEVPPLHQLHRVIRQPSALAELVDLDDVRVPQARDRLPLPQEAGDDLGVASRPPRIIFRATIRSGATCAPGR